MKVSEPDDHRSFFATEQANTLQFPHLGWLHAAIILFGNLFRTWLLSSRCFSSHVEPEDQVFVRTLRVFVDWAMVVVLLLPLEFSRLLWSIRVPVHNNRC